MRVIVLTGIGMEVHESPYLRGGSDDIILTGHAFSDEPGVYIEGQVCLPRPPTSCAIGLLMLRGRTLYL